MTVFWAIGAALALLALVLVLRPLLRSRGGGVSRDAANVAIYRDQLRELDADLAAGTLAPADHERLRREIEGRLLADVAAPQAAPASGSSRRAALAAGLAIPACAVALYFLVGNPGAIESPAAQLDAMVTRLGAHLRENPEDVAGWKLLGRSHAALGRHADAAKALANAAARAPRDAQLLADFADALAMARGQTMQGEPEKLVLRALELEPDNLKALALAGTAAFERRDFAGAGRYWQRMLPLVPADSEDARVIRANLDEARRMAGGARSLRGRVEISQELKTQLDPQATLYIFARAEKGPPMPLAAMKARASELPLEFSLDDSMAMAPGLELSAFPRVVVMARVSRAGTPAAQAGDLQGASQPVANDASGVTVLIDSVVR